MPNKKTYKALRGMPDILPEEAAAFGIVEERARKVFRIFEFVEIRTPLLEETEVFVRSIGKDTDIVEKEMYTLKDRSDKSISLRPEGTASVIRAFIENKLHGSGDATKLFYIGPMFRSERPQKGRLRQFHQIGAEIIGGSGPASVYDIELISSAKAVLTGIGVEGEQLRINSLGCGHDRKKYKTLLKKYLTESEKELCDNCRRRISTNVLRVLDCKNAECRKTVKASPKMIDCMCGDCSAYYSEVKKGLEDLNIEFKEDHDLVRGLDYYTGIVFEISHPSLGAQDAIAAGGRYDGLTSEMGGPDVGAIGYAIGIERVLMAAGEHIEHGADKGILVIAVDEAAITEARRTVMTLRSRGIACGMENVCRSLKAAMRRADKEDRSKVILIGEEEIKEGMVLLKDMGTGTQRKMTLEEVMREVNGE
ncbi:MAG: histidine--tRNA ligase [Candidatus Omnitrophica bacterium]|nr:histidine--tRNA ligase [Candidatus Omnitrophota bacterium]